MSVIHFEMVQKRISLSVAKDLHILNLDGIGYVFLFSFSVCLKNVTKYFKNHKT